MLCEKIKGNLTGAKGTIIDTKKLYCVERTQDRSDRCSRQRGLADYAHKPREEVFITADRDISEKALREFRKNLDLIFSLRAIRYQLFSFCIISSR